MTARGDARRSMLALAKRWPALMAIVAAALAGAAGVALLAFAAAPRQGAHAGTHAGTRTHARARPRVPRCRAGHRHTGRVRVRCRLTPPKPTPARLLSASGPPVAVTMAQGAVPLTGQVPVEALPALAPRSEPPPRIEEAPPAPPQRDCVSHLELCGFPGPEDAGVERGVVLSRHVGGVVVREGEAGTTIKDERIEGNLEIAANNVTVENVEVVSSSQRKVCEKTGGPEGGGAIQVRGHGAGEATVSTGIVISHVTVHGVTQGCPESLGEGISMREESSASDVKVQWSKVYWTRTCFFQSATWENNYCDDNAEIPGAHYDGIYANGEGTTRAKPGLVLRHNTILMPHWQTSPLFLSNEKEVGEEIVEHNFLAGGGYLMYLPGGDTKVGAGVVVGPVEVTGNRFARCNGKVVASITGGHHLCEGMPEENETTSTPLAGDGSGYFPYGGSYGVLYTTYNTLTDHLTGDYWDNNLEAILR